MRRVAREIYKRTLGTNPAASISTSFSGSTRPLTSTLAATGPMAARSRQRGWLKRPILGNMRIVCTIFALLWGTVACGAELTVQDETGCLEHGAVLAAVARWVPHPELVLEVSVLPEGEERAVQLHVVSPVQWQRDLLLAPADCSQAPELIALTVQRGVAGLPGMALGEIEITPNWNAQWGLALRVGVLPVAPSLSADLLFAVGARWQLIAGGLVGAGLQAFEPGWVYSQGGLAVLGAGMALDRQRLRAEVAGGVLRGQGSGFSENFATLLPRVELRGGVDAAISSRWSANVGLVVPLTPITWSAPGIGVVREPPVRLELGFSGNLFR